MFCTYIYNKTGHRKVQRGLGLQLPKINN